MIDSSFFGGHPEPATAALVPQFAQKLTDTAVTAGMDTTLQTITYTPAPVAHLFVAHIKINNPATGQKYVMSIEEDGVIIPRNVSAFTAFLDVVGEIEASLVFWYITTAVSHTYTLHIDCAGGSNYTVSENQLAIL